MEKTKTAKLIITTIILLALISLVVPHSSALDVSCRAIKARQSDVYSPNTAWELGYTGKGITIAIIDFGIDEEHESLQGKFVAGVDFTKPDTPLTPRDGSYNPDAGNAHGTHCASIIMGTGGSDGKYMGIAPDAKLIDVKIKPVGWTTRNIADAIEWCINHKDTDWPGQPPEYDGIDIISCSMGGGDFNSTGSDDDADRAANIAVESGMVVICGAGNNGPDNDGFQSPPAADKVITVGAIDDKNTINRDDDTILWYSNRGPRANDADDDSYDELKPDVVAPGEDIISAKYHTEDEYDKFNGTSASCPHVAGVVALMLEANKDLKPTADRNPIQEILRKTAESRGTPDSDLRYPGSDSYYNYSYGWGIVDAYKAVRMAEEWSLPGQNNPPTTMIHNPVNNAEVSGNVTISGTASDTDGNIMNVELRIDDNDWFNVPITVSSSLNWDYSWNTKNVENGKHTIYAKAYDGKNYSVVQSVDVNVHNKVSAGGIEEETKINPIYMISGAGIIGAVVIVVVCVLLFRRKKPSVKPGFPAVPPPVTGVPSVTAQCPNCGNIIEITSVKRPFKVRCSKCGARSILR